MCYFKIVQIITVLIKSRIGFAVLTYLLFSPCFHTPFCLLPCLPSPPNIFCFSFRTNFWHNERVFFHYMYYLLLLSASWKYFSSYSFPYRERRMAWMCMYHLRGEMRILSASSDSITLWGVRVACKWFSSAINIKCLTIKFPVYVLCWSVSSSKPPVVSESWLICICTAVLLFLPFPFQRALQKH